MTQKSVLFPLVLALSFSLTLLSSAASLLGSARPSPQSSAGIENPAALNSFFRQLTAIQSGNRKTPVRVLHYGDSHTKADLFTGEIRRDLQRDFGYAAPAYVQVSTAYTRNAGSTSSGIIYEALGVNGARAKRLHGLTQDGAFLQSIAQLRPDLIVIAYGTNEVTDDDWTIASYERMLVDMIRRFHSAAPGSSVLIIGPPDRAVQGSDGWISARKMSALLEAQRRAAFSANAALWSSYDAMGGAGSMNAWVARGLGRSDHVHLTAIGYNKLGRMFYSDLMNVYRSGSPAGPSSGLDNIDLRVMRGVPITKRP